MPVDVLATALVFLSGRCTYYSVELGALSLFKASSFRSLRSFI